MIETLAISFPGGWEWIVILVIALLIFGRRLPDVGKSLGKGIVEFKKGLKGMKSEMDSINDEVDEAVRKTDDTENHEHDDDVVHKEPAKPSQLEADKAVSDSAHHPVREKDNV